MGNNSGPKTHHNNKTNMPQSNNISTRIDMLFILYIKTREYTLVQLHPI